RIRDTYWDAVEQNKGMANIVDGEDMRFGAQHVQELSRMATRETPQPQAVQASAPQGDGIVVQRVVEPGTTTSPDSPQGLYTTPGDVESPHLDLGGQVETFTIRPDARIVEVDTSGIVGTTRG